MHQKGDLYNEIDRAEVERIQWEKQAFKEIEEGISEESIIFKNIISLSSRNYSVT